MTGYRAASKRGLDERCADERTAFPEDHHPEDALNLVHADGVPGDSRTIGLLLMLEAGVGNIEEVEIDPRTRALALRGCAEHLPELFLKGTTPEFTCPAGGQQGKEQPGLLRRTFGRLFGAGR